MKKDRVRSLSRREFGTVVAGSAAVPLLAAAQTQPEKPPAQPPDYVVPPRPVVDDAPPFSPQLEFTAAPVPPRAEPFPMPQVRLLPGNVFHDAQEWNRGYMRRLGADRWLAAPRHGVRRR